MSFDRVKKLAGLSAGALSAAMILAACQPDNTAAPTSSPSSHASLPPHTTASPRDTTPVAPTGGAGKAPYAGVISPKLIPLNATYQWTYGATDPNANMPESYQFERLCSAQDPALDEGEMARGKQVGLVFKATRGAQGGWQASESIEHRDGETSGVVQGTFALYQALANQMKVCPQYKSGSAYKLDASDSTWTAATFTIPAANGKTYVLHDYLVVARTTVAELALWAEAPKNGKPSVAWPKLDPKKVTADISAAVCAAYKGC